MRSTLYECNRFYFVHRYFLTISDITCLPTTYAYFSVEWFSHIGYVMEVFVVSTDIFYILFNSVTVLMLDTGAATAINLN